MAGTQTADVEERIPGERAETPAQIPPAGWWQVVRRAMKESTADNVPMLAGGVAFFAFLAVFPALIAAISLYGLIADPATVAAQLRTLAADPPAVHSAADRRPAQRRRLDQRRRADHRADRVGGRPRCGARRGAPAT